MQTECLGYKNRCSCKRILQLYMTGNLYSVGVEVYHRDLLNEILFTDVNHNYLAEMSCNNNHIFLQQF
jgi:hypothetical protein